MKSYREIAESVQHLRESDVAGKHTRDINLDILWSVVSGNDTRMGVAESLRGVSKRYVLNMTVTEFNDWMYEHRPLVEMFYDFATTADVSANQFVMESLSESLLEGNDFLKNLHSLISEENYIEASNQLKEATQEDLNAIDDSLYYFLAVNEAFTVADLCKPLNPQLWESMLNEAERTVDDHPSLASLALAAHWYMKEDGEWDNCNCKKDEVEEGFASAAQRRAAFASGYKAKGKKGNGNSDASAGRADEIPPTTDERESSAAMKRRPAAADDPAPAAIRRRLSGKQPVDNATWAAVVYRARRITRADKRRGGGRVSRITRAAKRGPDGKGCSKCRYKSHGCARCW